MKRSLRSWLWRVPVDQEIDEELALHIEMRTRELIARGMEPVAARESAISRLGDLARLKRTCVDLGRKRDREMRVTLWLEELRDDVTFAVRKGAADGGEELVTIGKAYSGLTDLEIAALTERFIAETIEEHGRFRVVRPTLVLEVAFDQITRSERHTSGFALRFPRIVRIRDDKTVAEIDTLERVEQVFRSPDNLAVGLEGEKRAESGAKGTDADQLSLF